MPPRTYITTPIYYVNDKPHIGHTYTTMVCDVYARFMRFAGSDVFFLTGTDEHGVKVEKSAAARGITPQALADENSAEFKRVMASLGLEFDHFIRTTDPDHVRQAQHFVRKLVEADAVYLGEFEGWYDEGQEEYYTETKARDIDYKSPVSGKPLVRATEKNSSRTSCARSPGATRCWAVSAKAWPTCPSPGRTSPGACRCPTTRSTSSTCGSRP
jgi:methionyl-tRNA synthetase